MITLFSSQRGFKATAFDLLFNNTTDIDPDVHSTDTHGTNEVNFALLHVFGYQFAPRYRDIQAKVQKTLYGFKHPTQYGTVLLKPVRKINPRLIVEEWEQMQRIFVSLAHKTTTQHIIVCGRYEFTKRLDTINMAALIQALAQVPVPQHLAL